jgi:hypothetical protein
MLQRELDAAMKAARRAIDATGYGRWVSDDKLQSVVIDALEAARTARLEWKAEQKAKSDGPAGRQTGSSRRTRPPQR